jgi:hypothetical protein
VLYGVVIMISAKFLFVYCSCSAPIFSVAEPSNPSQNGSSCHCQLCPRSLLPSPEGSLPLSSSARVHSSSRGASGSLKQGDNIVTDFAVLEDVHVASKVTFCPSVNGNDGELLPPQAQPTARKVCVKVCVKGRPEGRFLPVMPVYNCFSVNNLCF